ncbi:MAG: type I methionyl aminopeptidase [bacterium]|nr:type I methionyl aminopeptidase [bacterium]
MIKKKTSEEIEKLRRGGALLAQTLFEVIAAAKPGVTTAELDALAEKSILAGGAQPSFKGYQNFPKTLCTSINEQVVHVIPDEKTVLKEGDIIGLDLGLWYEGLCTDMARTIPVGNISEISRRLIEVTDKSFEIGLAQVKPGNHVGDIGAAIQQYVEKLGYGVVRTLFGHGVGYKVHEDPYVPNFGQAGTGPELAPGLVIAIEPMITVGSPEVQTADDGWAISTVDGSLAAHHEDTVVVTETGVEVLTRK